MQIMVKALFSRACFPGVLVLAVAALPLAISGCADDLRSETRSADEVWGPGALPPDPLIVAEPVHVVERSDEVTYGLPRAGEPSIADLLALLPERVDNATAEFFVGATDTLPVEVCRGGGVEVLSGLPMTIEAVVSLHPRQYIRASLCDQDVRHYGVFVVEDDTGGVVVLRDSRIAHYTHGDRVRITVRAMSQLFRDAEQRSVVSFDIERIPEPFPGTEAAGAVLYTSIDRGFDASDLGRTRRIEGFVGIRPTQSNFNQMVVTTTPIPEAPLADVDRVCIDRCNGECGRSCASQLCREDICPALCILGDGVHDSSLLPDACWSVNIGIELGRRGFSPPTGSRISVTAPVVKGFQVHTMWVQRAGQVEALD